jgi:hypothetical protein
MVVDAGCLLGWLVWLLLVSARLDVISREGKSHQGGDIVSLPLVDDGLMVG